ncbi:MAG: hypothetical protein A2551_07765 [Elusimicrobia bacterium RIFOXYD2_FULL_34_30]|nr:MAG: hypothetical protein A2551_07765 [Elusimicrobia bacterium RIFOXYD2_FULL_34_30]
MKKVYLLICIIVFATLSLYIHTINYPFIYDDIGYLKNNSFIKDPKNLTKLFSKEYFESGELSYRPVVTFSYIISYYLLSERPYGYRFFNIFLYIFTVIIFYFLCVEFFNDKTIAFLSAFFFLSHPVHTEVLMQITFNEELFVTLFFLMSFYYHIKNKIIFGTLFFLLSMFSKEIGIGFPLVVLFYDIIKSNKISVKKYIIYFICIVLYIFIRFYALTGIAPDFGYIGGSFYKNILTMSKVFILYIKLLFIPIDLRPIYYFEIASSLFQPMIILSLTTIIVFILSIVILFKRDKNIAFCMVWFLITIIPVMNFIPFLKYSFLSERYLFLPSAGFCMFLGLIIEKLSFLWLKKNSVSLVFISISILLFYITQTITRTYDWKDEFTFWLKASIREPKSFMAHTNLGVCYVSQNKIDLAIAEYKTAAQLYPVVEQFTAMGDLYLGIGFYNYAIENYEIALQSNFNNKCIIHNNIGFCYLQKGLNDEAIKNYNKAIEINPKYVDAYNNRAVTYGKKGLYNEAIKDLKKAADLGNKQARENLKKYFNIEY